MLKPLDQSPYPYTIILQGVVGSRAYGLDTPDSDYDRTSIAVYPLKTVLSLAAVQESMAQNQGDGIIHEVRKFLRLAVKSNPHALDMLWLPAHEICDDLGSMLIGLRATVLSRRVAGAYTGFASAQAHKLLEGKADARPDKLRKFARHAQRLLIQGEQLLTTGHLDVKLSPENVALCWDVSERAVKSYSTDVSPRALLRFAGYVEREVVRVRSLEKDSVLPVEPDLDAVNDILYKIHIAQ